jgi:hypothetical protein
MKNIYITHYEQVYSLLLHPDNYKQPFELEASVDKIFYFITIKHKATSLAFLFFVNIHEKSYE